MFFDMYRGITITVPVLPKYCFVKVWLLLPYIAYHGAERLPLFMYHGISTQLKFPSSKEWYVSDMFPIVYIFLNSSIAALYIFLRRLV